MLNPLSTGGQRRNSRLYPPNGGLWRIADPGILPSQILKQGSKCRISTTTASSTKVNRLLHLESYSSILILQDSLSFERKAR